MTHTYAASDAKLAVQPIQDNAHLKRAFRLPAARKWLYELAMERTASRLGGVAIASSIMNASGARSAERAEIVELHAAHGGALVFKSCNLAGLEQPENLKNRGVEYFSDIARDLAGRGARVIGSVVGASEDEFVEVARRLDRAGVQIIELNLADDYVTRTAAPFASYERLKALLGRVRGETSAVMAVKMPASLDRAQARPIAELLKSLRIAIAVCFNDLPKDLEVDLASGIAKGPRRVLSQAHAFHLVSDRVLDVVAVGGVSTGREAYIAHLTGACGVQVGSALMKEGVGALGRIDRELDGLLAQQGKRSVADIIGQITFAG
jgi:dihydroorotate dehydrogenase (fumarate)